jgi:uracil-DNA glycosylase
VTPSHFVAALAEVRLPGVFNPYSDRCAVHDRPDAARLRRRNLEAFLQAALKRKVETIWVARDLGYRGGRRTGVPLTDEVHLNLVGHLLGDIQLKRATRGPVVAERTAAVVWKVLSRIGQPVVLWNVFPFHPHEPDDPFSNRCHTSAERQIALPLLKMLIKMFQPRRLIAIGRDAQIALRDIAIPVTTVRHPSYGGQNDFIAGLYDLYGVDEEVENELDLRDPAIDKQRSSPPLQVEHTVLAKS